MRKSALVLFFLFLGFLFWGFPVFASDSLYFLHTDHLGSTRVVTDSGGTPVAEYDYYPYGSINNQQSTINNQAIERLYTAQIKDSSADLYFYNSRYYNPSLGHFISAEPVEGPNRYLYVAGHPINTVDPTGNSTGQPPTQPVPWITWRVRLPAWLKTPARIAGEVFSVFSVYRVAVEGEQLVTRIPTHPTAYALALHGGIGTVSTFDPSTAPFLEDILAAQEAKKQRVIQLRAEGAHGEGGWTLTAIAREFGVKSKVTIRDWFKKWGVVDPLGGRKGVDPLRQTQEQAVLQDVHRLRSEQWVWEEVAEEVGYTNVGLYKFLKRHEEFVDPLKGGGGIPQWRQGSYQAVWDLIQKGYTNAQIARKSEIMALGLHGMGYTPANISILRKKFAGWGGPLPPLE